MQWKIRRARRVVLRVSLARGVADRVGMKPTLPGGASGCRDLLAGRLRVRGGGRRGDRFAGAEVLVDLEGAGAEGVDAGVLAKTGEDPLVGGLLHGRAQQAVGCEAEEATVERAPPVAVEVAHLL